VVSEAAIIERLDRIEQLLQRLVPAPTPPALRALLDALAGEFGSSPIASREVRAAAKSPLKRHEALRKALRQLQVDFDDAEAIGRALRRLTLATAGSCPRVVSCKRERGAGVWAIEGLDPA
jgi:predicted nucleic acid-binding protein